MKNVLSFAMLAIAFAVVPVGTHASSEDTSVCHPVGMKRMIFCMPYQWGALEEIENVKTKNLDSDGTRILQMTHFSPTTEGMKEDDTTLVSVHAWKSKQKLRPWVSDMFSSKYAESFNKKRRKKIFPERTTLARSITYTDDNGQEVHERVVFAQRKNRLYMVQIHHWGEKGEGWNGAKRILRSFRLR